MACEVHPVVQDTQHLDHLRSARSVEKEMSAAVPERGDVQAA
jgi:hypothetical protein